jgi:hypothetical protein
MQLTYKTGVYGLILYTYFFMLTATLLITCKEDGKVTEEGKNHFALHFCTPDDALVVRNIFYIQILSQFVKPPCDTLLRYFNMFHPSAITIVSTIQRW